MKIDCARYADEILNSVKECENKKRLVILSVGDNPASKSYVKGKIKDCERCDIPYQYSNITDDENRDFALHDAIRRANGDDMVGGIIVQLPLPEGMNETFFTNCVKSAKDVDGFKSDSPFSPCTPEGIVIVLKKELGNLEGRDVLVIGKGKLVGKPLVPMLMDEHCTVTVAGSRTKNLSELCSRKWDAIVTAVGKANLLDLSTVNAEVVVDAGITRNEQGKLCGDCCGDNENVRYTTVPGGVGLMTRAVLMSHMITK